MMPRIACCDTSFLFSLYGRDDHTADAATAVKRFGQPLVLTVLNEFELLNAIRFAVFRRVLPATAGVRIIAAFEEDLVGKKIIIERCNLAMVVTEAKRLSDTHTLSGGHRSLDILHVAAATQLAADIFFSFDGNQRTLAAAMGLKVGPS